MFSACGKYRPDLPTRNAYRTIRGGRVARGVLRSRDFEDGKVAETSTLQAQCALLKRIRPLAPRHGSRGSAGPFAGGRRVLQGGPHLRRRRGLPAASRSGRPVRDITGHARGRRQCRPSSLFPGLGESFRC
jgi:hypothetical protein